MNINTAKIKYVVAREGLIIVSLLICMAVSFYIDSSKSDKVDKYIKSAKEVELIRNQNRPSLDDIYKQTMGISSSQSEPPQQTKSQSELDKEWKKATPIPNNGEYFEPLGIKYQFPRMTTNENIKKTIEQDYPNDKQISWVELGEISNTNISNRFDDKGNKVFIGFPWNIDFKNRVAFFLFLAYPAYLLLRFIVWASLIVRNKK